MKLEFLHRGWSLLAVMATLLGVAHAAPAAEPKPNIVQTEFSAMCERMHVPPALPGEEFDFNEEQ